MSSNDLKLPENINIGYQMAQASLSIVQKDGELVASIGWTPAYKADFETADAFAGSIIYLTETGHTIVEMVESGELQTIIETKMFVSPKSVFIPMKTDKSGVLGFDMQKDTLEYVPYGSLLCDYEERREITQERERNRADYEKQLAKHLKR